MIRDDRTLTAEAEPEIVLPDPVQAKQNMDVGDFYFKKGNFKAAADRYRDAVRYGPTSARAYDKLVKALEKLDAFSEAAEACEDFIANNPESNQVTRFEEKAQELKEMIQG